MFKFIYICLSQVGGSCMLTVTEPSGDSANITDGQWHHASITDMGDIYVDGALHANGSQGSVYLE